MNVTLESYALAELVRLEGPLNAACTDRVRHDLEGVFVRGPRILVFDLAQVPDMDSSGIGTLIWALKRMRTQGGDVRILNLHGMVKRLFDLLHLERTMTVCTTLEQAIAPPV